MPSPRRSSEQIRAAIAQAAIDVVGAGGLGALTHRAVAAEAQVSLSSTTYHFASRHDIIAAAIETGQPVLAVEGDSAFGFSGMEVETICRYGLPVCVVVFNNGGIYRGTDVNPSGGPDAATTVFVPGARYDRMMEAFGGVGVNATSPDELRRAVNEAMDSGRPTLINAVIDPAAGTESGRIGNLNPQSVVSRK